MPSNALHPRTAGIRASVIVLLGVVVVATAVTSAGAAAPAVDRSQKALETEQTAETTANATVYVAPGQAWDDLDNSSAIARHLENGRLTHRNGTIEDPGVVTVNDTLVVAVTLPGLGERLSAAPGENTTARMRSLVAGENASLSVVEQNPSTERPAMLADLLAVNGSTATRVVAGDGDTAYFVVDVDEVVVEYSSSDNSREKLIEAPYYDRIFRFNLTFEATSATTFFNTHPPEAAVPRPPGADTALLPTAADATLVGRANLAPGTALNVTVVDDSDRELAAVTVPVDEDGRFTTTVDTTDVANSTLEVRVAIGSTAFDPIPVAVRDERASLTLADQGGEGQRVVLDEVSLSHGGLVVVRRGAPDGPIVGVMALKVGTHSDVAVEFDEPLTESATIVVTAHRDVNANRAFDDGLDDAYGTVADASYRVESGTELTATPTATTAEDTDGETTSGTSTSRDDASGFGLSVTIVALLAALVAGRYRRPR